MEVGTIKLDSLVPSSYSYSSSTVDLCNSSKPESGTGCCNMPLLRNNWSDSCRLPKPTIFRRAEHRRQCRIQPWLWSYPTQTLVQWRCHRRPSYPRPKTLKRLGLQPLTTMSSLLEVIVLPPCLFCARQQQALDNVWALRKCIFKPQGHV
jgi:hypothetical protein